MALATRAVTAVLVTAGFALHPAGTVAAAQAATEEVLHDNGYNYILGPAVSSQDFSTDAYDSEASDDFTSRQAWTITRLRVRGQLEPSRVGGLIATVPPRIDRVVIRFYAGDVRSGAPAVEVPGARRTVVPTMVSGGSFDAALAGDPVTLPKGTYWLSVQTMHSDLEGQWFWSSIAGVKGRPALWRNPGRGFGISHCQQWAPLDSCFGSSLYDDLSWTLSGYRH